MNERDVFISALQKEPSERSAYLDSACAGNPALRRRIDSLLKAHDDPDDFLELPPDVDATSVDSLGQERPSTLGFDDAIPDDTPASTPEADLEASPTNDIPAGSTVAAAPRPNAEEPGSRIGHYKLLQKIGEGGMGIVYMAEQEKPVSRRVALKVIKPGMDTDQVVARFDAERQALAIMDHNNIAKVFDAGATESGRPYFVMELVSGIPITDFCDRANLSPRERLKLFIPVCQAIQHAHQKGIIHRDVKPSNILITLHDGKPVPKVIDFGIAKAISQRLTERTMFTQFGAIVGTLEYMSPEQAEMSGMDIDTRTDVYALGVVLYELLAGTTPLQRTSLREAAFAEILRRIREEEPPKPSKRLSDSGESLASISAHRKTEPVRLAKLVRGELDWIVMKSLEKDRGRRYETASAFAQDIQRYLEGDPVEACPPSASYKLRKLARKHRAALATVGAFAIVLVIATAISAGLAVWANRERVRAVTAENSAKEQQVRAQEREQMAIDAVRRYGDVVRESAELKNDPGLAKLRATLLKEPQAFFKRLRDRLQADRDTTPESLVRLAAAVFDLALLTDEIGDREDALSGYLEALAIRDQLGRLHPPATELERDLARVHNNIGALQSETGRPAEAIASYEAARAIWERLARENRSVIAFQEGLAWCYHNTGILQSDTGRRAEAMESYERARAIRERLASENPSNIALERDLAKNHNDIGSLQHASGRLEDALASYEKSRAIWERLVKEDPSATAFHGGLAWSYHNIGILKSAIGRPTQALASQEHARAIREFLVRENPSVTAFQRDLARSHNDIGGLHHLSGRLVDALASLERARAIWARLASANPSVTAFQGGLAWSYHNIGILQSDMGRPAEALESYERARAIRERLARENLSVTALQRDLAKSYSNIGGLREATGRPAAALAAVERARAIWERLVRENPSATDFGEGLAWSYHNIGVLHRATGRRAEAMECFHRARAHWERLARDHPDMVRFTSNLGGTLDNMAMIDLDERRFEVAWAKLILAIECQRKILAASPDQPGCRQFLAGHLTNLIRAAEGLGRVTEAAAAGRELAELEAADPARATLDVRLAAVLKGQPPIDDSERLTLGHRAYEKSLHFASAGLYAEALAHNPKLGDLSQAQHRYSAACAASLAACDKGKDGPPPGDAARVKLRLQVREWLRADLVAWSQVFDAGPAEIKAEIAPTLQHWKADSDLASIRDEPELAKLPEQERAAFRLLWNDVELLLIKATVIK